MYRFVDTVERPDMIQPLPTEAVSINTRYLEHIIEGYRTISVSGRETMEADVTELDDGITNGSIFLRRRYRPRTITVRYQLKAKDTGAFIQAYNKLKAALSVSQGAFIFNDERDKFFIGTPSMVKEVTSGVNSVVGEWEIYCNDPFKRDLNFTVYELFGKKIYQTQKVGGVITGALGDVLVEENNTVIGNGSGVSWTDYALYDLSKLYYTDAMGDGNARLYRGSETVATYPTSQTNFDYTYSINANSGYETEVFIVVVGTTYIKDPFYLRGCLKNRITGAEDRLCLHANSTRTERVVGIDGVSHTTDWYSPEYGGDGVVSLPRFPTLVPGKNPVSVNDFRYAVIIAYRGKWL